jgi:signal transduction histidine kinase
MKIAAFIDFFIGKERFEDRDEIRRARLFVRACILTSLFSNSYVWSSLIFGYEKGVYLMIFNVVGFMILPFMARTKWSIAWLGNIYVFVGAFAVIVLTHYSGGLWSAVYPWIISIPVLALLVVNRLSAAIWGAISFTAMVWYGVLAIQGVALPLEYNVALKTEWFVVVVPGLLLMVLFISFVFESMQTNALNDLAGKNDQLELQKETIAVQSVELERLIEDKNYIIRILAHDVRNPLKNIAGLVNLMKMDNSPGEQGEYVDMIMRASINAQELVNKVLEMDATDQQDLGITMERLDVVAILTATIDEMQKNAAAKNIQIELDNQSTNGMAQGDQTYLKLIFENLISNAVKFSDNGKVVRAKISNSATSLLVKITDEGPGIDPEEEDRLFKKFSRLSTRPTAGEGSTGLGLSLVKRYVELIGGRVWYEPNEEKGATFAVELPHEAA